MLAKTLVVKARHIKTLVLPLFVWCGAVASLDQEMIEQLRRAILVTSHVNVAVDAPPIALFELMGWECDPQFARHWSALGAVASYVGRPAVWLEDATVAMAVKPWFMLLPLATAVLPELGWWTDERGSRFFVVMVVATSALMSLRTTRWASSMTGCGTGIGALHWRTLAASPVLA